MSKYNILLVTITGNVCVHVCVRERERDREHQSAQMHTRETAVTRSYIMIPASARARLAHDIITGRSPVVIKT